MIIKPLTCPDSFRNIVKVIDAMTGTFTSTYFDKTNRVDQDNAPAGTQSWTDKLLANEQTMGWVAPATVFLSHVYAGSFRRLVAGLKQLVADLPPDAPHPFLWIDFLCVDQHVAATVAAAGARAASNPKAPCPMGSQPCRDPFCCGTSQDWWSTTFKEAVGRIGRTVMLLSPWDSPVTLTRGNYTSNPRVVFHLYCPADRLWVVPTAWCLWELYCTIDTDADFAVCLDPAERKAFETALLKSPRSVIKALSKVDVEASQSSNGVERAAILGEVNEQFTDDKLETHYMKVDGGPVGLNTMAMAELRDRWVVGSAWALVAMQTGREGDLETEEALEVGRKVASLMGVHFGKWTEAKTLWNLVASGCDTLYGADARSTLQARSQLAQAMRYLNELHGARALYEEVMDRQTLTLDKHDETLLVTKQNFANLLRSSLRDYSAARDLEEAVVAGFTKLRGPDHERTLLARGNFALTLDMEGKIHDARREYEAVLKIQRERLGPRHPHTLHTQYNLALLIRNRLGDVRGGRKLLAEVVTGGTAVLGAGHPQTKKASRALAQWGRGW